MRTLALVFLLIGSLSGCRQSAPSPAPESSTLREPAAGQSAAGQSAAGQSAEAIGITSTGTATFQIKDGEKVVTLEVNDVHQGETLEAVMRRINQLPISIRGSGVTAFVDQIGQTATSGSEGWTYTIDGEFATRGIGETTLSPPTTVEWSFGAMQEP